MDRYDFFCSYDGGGPAEETPCHDGGYVRFEDAKAELQALRKDAERYRWLRERETEVRRYTLVGQRASERLDDQIDAAIEESKAVGAA